MVYVEISIRIYKLHCIELLINYYSFIYYIAMRT